MVPLRRCPGGSPASGDGSQSSHSGSLSPAATLQPTPSTRNVPKLSPVVAQRVHVEPLSGLIFTNESVVTVCREGYVKIWMRPGIAESQSNISEIATLSSSSKDKSPLSSSIVGSLSFKQ